MTPSPGLPGRDARRDYGTRLNLDAQAAFRGAALLACAPFGYFFRAPYSEGTIGRIRTLWKVT